MADLTICDLCPEEIKGLPNKAKLMKANGRVEGRHDYSKLKVCDDCWELHVEFLFENGDGPK